MGAEEITSLPPQLTSFVGRQGELLTVRERLADGGCRLLTLVGPGGVGKTRLALEAVRTTQSAFEDGVFFAPLQSAVFLGELISAIADVLNLPLSGGESRQQQLIHYLRHKSVLLLLDNFEQLLSSRSRSPRADVPLAAISVEDQQPDCVAFLSQLLLRAPGVRLLVTSREPLRLQEECLYPLAGLSYAVDAGVEDLLRYDAVRLFVARAQRLQPAFAVHDEALGIARICQLTDGMPLALELAATWTRILSCAEIATEIEKNVAFLATSLRNVSPRHRSMVAVFDHSWNLLSPPEQLIFQKLSVFRGGFQRAAAAAIAGASLSNLSTLVDKSLLHRAANGRYQIHELLRQFGEAKLAQDQDAAVETGDAHCHYYMAFLHERMPHINDRRQRQAAAAIAVELDNIRAAWKWAVQQCDIEALAWGVSTYFYFCQMQSRYLESAEALAAAAAALDQATPSPSRDFTLARTLGHLGWMRIRLGQFEQADEALTRCRDLYTRLQRAPLPYMGTDPATPTAIVALINGQHDRAVTLGEAARRAAEKRHDNHNLSFAHYALTAARNAQGDYDAAYAHGEKACHLSHALGNDWFLPYALNEWGNVCRAMGNFDEARRHFRSSYELKEAFEDREGMAVALNHLAEIDYLRRDYASAQRLYQQALALYQDLNDRGGLATSLKGLAQSAAAQGDDLNAKQQFGRALRIATDIEYWPLVFSTFVEVCPLLQRSQEASRAIELLSLVRHHPAANEEIRARAAAQLEHCKAKLPSQPFEVALRRGATQDLSIAIASLQAALDLAPKKRQTGARAENAMAIQPLEEPLTTRELQVLERIASGQTNAQIAAQLIIAPGTVKWYASQIYGKLRVSNRTEAAMRARALGLLD